MGLFKIIGAALSSFKGANDLTDAVITELKQTHGIDVSMLPGDVQKYIFNVINNEYYNVGSCDSSAIAAEIRMLLVGRGYWS